MKTARTYKVHVENLVAAMLHGHAPDPDTSDWVGGRDDVMYGKLAAVGLVPPREPVEAESQAATLGEFLDQYISGRTDIKPSTRCNLEQVRRNLVDYFGAERLLASITPGDTDEFRVNLLGKLGENTVRRNCGRAKQFFRAAVRKKLIVENPFADMKGCAVKATTDRMYFVTQEVAVKVLEACPDAQWRLLFALSRYGGLRCPSEHLALRLDDVDWERDRITVHSPKTEHHEGKESRQIPIFPELRPYLNEVWDQAAPGNEFLITRYRSGNANLRTQLERIIRKAGLKPWPKPFQNSVPPGRRNWPNGFPCTSFVRGSATPKRWRPSTTSRCETRTLIGLRGATQKTTHARRKRRRSNQRAILAHPGKKRRKPMGATGLCHNLLGIATITQTG